ncbi:peptidase domain-containing ABC transporter [Haliangium ochraceum]|uniref:ABC transporter related protein n=1 Tax=Haliangium ochraceum (strain DSM 14365 / JCM 11303 / SMP-2) TaxID=502025 RepID=D0LR02_HALO1|nr:peptidase domain-containing ABC transporter [Haliangium ochraceum]ACY15510.1 ABC transporter related protein [Haliangium ochraceum DSM 14365]
MSLFGKNKLPTLYQTESSECALACLAMVAGYHGLDISMLELRERFPISMKGATLRDVVEVANQIGFSSRPVRCEPAGLRRIALPALLHWDFEHFVVLERADKRGYRIHDPAIGVVHLSENELSDHFTGVAVILSPTDDFAGGELGEKLSLWQLLKRSRGMVPFVAQVLWLTAFLELFALLGPLFLKEVIDTGLAHRSFDLITAIAVGIGAIGLFQGLLSFLRDYVILYFGTSFNQQMMNNLFRHLLRLPMHFYEKRITGDLIDRYQSTDVIRRVFTSNLPTILLDGLVTVIALSAVFLISPILAAIALASFAVYLGMRIYFYSSMRTLTEKAVRARSEENGHVIDTLRGMQPIKIFAKELERLNIWGNFYARLINAEKDVGVLAATQSGFKLFILGVDTALCVYFGANLVAQGELSLGILLAFFFYKAHFTQKSVNFAERLMDLRLVAVHVDRLSDIALSEPEQQVQDKQPVTREAFADFRVAFANVGFRYAPLEPDVVQGASCELRRGEFVALVGPSGGGKTTLFKLLLGLLQPSEGHIEFNGTPLSELDIRQYRRHFGVVMQEDLLLTGTLLDNIAFFEASPDENKARRCAEIALILDEIEAMPMKLNTRIGDLGSALSGGQKQRILLARALYGEPEVMLLDEGTANLDQAVERQLLDNLTALGITCISIAHRPETIYRATKVLRLENGTLTDVTDAYADAQTPPQREEHEMKVRYLEPRPKNHSSNVALLMKLWDTPLTGEQQERLAQTAPVKQQRSEFGNLNNEGTPYPSQSCLVARFHPDFESVIEPGVKELLAVVAIDLDLVTYTSCQGHRYENPDTPTDERHVGIIARSAEEHQRVRGLFEDVARELNPGLADSAVEIAIMDHTVRDGDTIYPALDLYLSQREGHSLESYFAELDQASDTLITALRSRAEA